MLVIEYCFFVLSFFALVNGLSIRQTDTKGVESTNNAGEAAASANSPALINNTQASNISLPFKVPGEPFADYLIRVLGGQSNQWGTAPNLKDDATVVSTPDLISKKAKRQVSDYGVFSSVWTSGNDFYNITADFRQCFGLAETSNMGIYSTHLDYTIYGATWGQVVTDLVNVQANTPEGEDPYAAVIILNAQEALNEAQDLLDDIICENPTGINTTAAAIATGNSETGRATDELRKLLLDQNEVRRWVAIVLNAIAGGIVGFALSASNDQAFKGHLDAQNEVQTSLVVAIVAICVGLIDFNRDRGNLDPVVQGVEAASGATVRVKHATAQLAATSRARATLTSVRARRTTRRGSRNYRLGLRFANGRRGTSASVDASANVAAADNAIPQTSEAGGDGTPDTSDEQPACLNPGHVVVDISPPNEAGQQQVETTVTETFGVEPIAEAEEQIDKNETPYNCP